MILMKGNFLGCEMKGAGLPRPRDSNSDGGSHTEPCRRRAHQRKQIPDVGQALSLTADCSSPDNGMQRQRVFKVNQETTWSAQNSTRSKNILQGW